MKQEPLFPARERGQEKSSRKAGKCIAARPCIRTLQNRKNVLLLGSCHVLSSKSDASKGERVHTVVDWCRFALTLEAIWSAIRKFGPKRVPFRGLAWDGKIFHSTLPWTGKRGMAERERACERNFGIVKNLVHTSVDQARKGACMPCTRTA